MNWSNLISPFEGGEIDWLQVFSTAIITPLIILPFLLISIGAIRRRHPYHVYGLWYVFSFMQCFAIIFCIYMLQLSNTDKPDNFFNFMNLAVSTAMNVKDEFIFVTLIIMITILPQIIAYIISGLFGCASTPIFISTILKISIFSIAKFFCAWSAFVLVITCFLSKLAGRGLVLTTTLAPKSSYLTLFTAGFIILTVGFVVVALYDSASNILSHFSFPASLNRFMTRYSNPSYKQCLKQAIVALRYGDVDRAAALLERAQELNAQAAYEVQKNPAAAADVIRQTFGA